MNIFSKTTVPVLEKSLSAYSLRQKVIADNLANIETPGYTRQSVTFEDELSQALKNPEGHLAAPDPHHIPIGSSGTVEYVTPRVTTAASQGGDPYLSGVNNVDIDTEMVELAKNQMRFRLAARMMQGVFQGLQKAIRGQS